MINILSRHRFVSLRSPLALTESTMPQKTMPLENMSLTESTNQLVVSIFIVASSLSIKSSPNLWRWIARAKGWLPLIALATMEIAACFMLELDGTLLRGTIC